MRPNIDGEGVLLVCLSVCLGFHLLANLAKYSLRLCFQKPQIFFL